MPAVHAAGHHDVGEQKIERGSGVDAFEGFGRVRRRYHGITETPEANRHEVPHEIIVLDAQDRLVPAVQIFITGRGHRRRRTAAGLRKIDPERCAVSLLAEHHDVAAGLLDESKHHAQPEPRACPELLGGKERLKNPVADGDRNAGAAIGNLDDDVVAIAEPVRLRLVRVKADIVGPQHQLAAIRHGVPPVDREIDQRRTQLAAIDQSRPALLGEYLLDLDLPAECRQQQLHDFLDQRVDIGLDRLQRLLAGERQQIGRELGGAVGRVVDHLDDRRERGVVLDALGQDLDRARDHGQHVVEVVGDATSQLPDGVHLLGLEKLFLCRTLGCDVPHERVDDEPIAAAQRSQRHLGKKLVAILVPQGRFVPPAGGVGRSLAEKPIDPLPVHRALRFRKHQLFHAHADRLGACPPHQGFGVRAPVEDHAGFIGLDKGVERTVDDRLRHLLAVDQRLVRSLLFGHVADEGNRPAQATCRVPQRTRRRRDSLPDTGRLGLDDELHIVDILAMQRARHRRILWQRARHTVGPEIPERVRSNGDRKIGPEQPLGGGVEDHDISVRIDDKKGIADALHGMFKQRHPGSKLGRHVREGSGEIGNFATTARRQGHPFAARQRLGGGGNLPQRSRHRPRHRYRERQCNHHGDGRAGQCGACKRRQTDAREEIGGRCAHQAGRHHDQQNHRERETA